MDLSDCGGPYCPYFRSAVELIGRRWTGAIIRALLGGVNRFSDLRDTIPDMSDKMLAERLKELESEVIVKRVVIPETPVRVEYHLTPKGRALANVVRAVIDWTDAWLKEQGASASSDQSAGGRSRPHFGVK